MKKILFVSMLLICCGQSFGQILNFNPMDSTMLFTDRDGSGVQRFNKLRPVSVQSLSRTDSSGKLKMLVVDTTRAAAGLKSVYWIDIPAGGSGGGGGGGTPGGSNKQIQYNSSGSFAGSGNLTQETNQILVTGSSTSVVPFRITPASGATVSGFRVDNYLGDSVFTIDPTGNAYIGKQTTVNYTRTFTFAYGLDAYSSAGFRIKDLSGGNGVVLNAASGGYLDIRDVSGSGGGLTISNWKNPSTGNTLSAGGNGFYTSSTDWFGVGVSPSTYIDINGNKFRLRNAKTPSSASDTGNEGDICWDTSYIYICTATNTWKRVAIATW